VTDRQRSTALEWAIAAVQGQLDPAVLSEAELRQFVGTYGTFSVTLAGDHIEYRMAGTALRMIPVGEDTFLLEGVYDQRLRFQRDETGTVTSVVGLTREGPGTAYRRGP
jgi:hypothetical protein